MEDTTFVLPARRYEFAPEYGNTFKFGKKVVEVCYVVFEYKKQLPTNNILNDGSSTVTADDGDGTDVTSTLIDEIEVVDDTKLKCRLKAGTDGEDYKVLFKGVTDPDACVYVGEILLQVRNSALNV